MKKEINIILYVGASFSNALIRESVVNAFSDFNLIEVTDSDTFFSTLLNMSIDLFIIRQNLDGRKGLDHIISLKLEDISIPFILVIEGDDEGAISRIAELGGYDFILENEDRRSIARKLGFVKSKLLFNRQREETGGRSGLDYKFDEITGLFNRQEFMKHLSDGSMKTVLLIDIDDFNLVNHAYGIEVGDYLLKSIASLLKESLPEPALVFRIAGDEFTVLLKGLDRNAEIALAENIIQMFSRACVAYGNLELKVSVTIGIARGDHRFLLRDADVALRRARNISKNRFEEYYFDVNLEEKQKNNLLWASRIKQALDDDRFLPHFQPIFNNNSLKVEKYECLVRMILGNEVILPDRFLEPAKKSGLMPYITKVMIDKCFKAFQPTTFDFSINISAIDLKHNYLVDYIDRKLREYGIKPDRFIIEISEEIQSSNIQEDILQVFQLKELGVKIAFDDFGTGHSNFSRILEFKADYIKIDGSFVKFLDRNGKSYKISHAISEFGRSIDIEIIAEFVHSKAVYDKVKELRINYSQGYYFGKPSQSIDKP